MQAEAGRLEAADRGDAGIAVVAGIAHREHALPYVRARLSSGGEGPTGRRARARLIAARRPFPLPNIGQVAARSAGVGGGILAVDMDDRVVAAVAQIAVRPLRMAPVCPFGEAPPARGQRAALSSGTGLAGETKIADPPSRSARVT